MLNTNLQAILETRITEDKQVDKLAQILWDYHRREDELSPLVGKSPPADAILCFTSVDYSIGNTAAELLNQGYAPLMIISGKEAVLKSKLTNWGMTEAQKFLQEALLNTYSQIDSLI